MSGSEAVSESRIVQLCLGSGPDRPAAKLAAMITRSANAPIALIHLTEDGERLQLAGAAGMPDDWPRFGPTPTSVTLAGLVLGHQHPIIIADITEDPRVPRYAPARTLGVRAYAGFPIRDPQERVVGVCTVVDLRPRRWTPDELAAVDEAAQACTALVAEQQRADTHRRFLEAVLQHLHVAVAACDENGRLVFTNAATRLLSGAMPIGAHISECVEHSLLTDDRGRPVPFEELPLCRALRGDQVCDAELTVSVPGKPTKTVYADAQPIVGADGRRLGAVVAVRDVTDRCRAERFRHVEQAVADALKVADDIHEAAPGILATVCVAFGWPRSELWLADREAGALVLAARFPDGEGAPSPAEADVLTEAAWRTGAPVWTCDPPDGAAKPKTGLAVPAPSGGRVLAVLSFFAAAVDDPADPLISLLSGIGTRIAEFLERRRADELTVALDRSRNDYLALISHELRTPLTSIGAYVEMLRESDPATVADDLPGLLDVLGRNSTALRRIIDQLLDLAALDGGHAQLACEPVNLAAVVEAAAKAVQPLASAAGVCIALDLDAGPTITGDPVRIRQMADHLLDNAVKHTIGGGRVTVAVTRPRPAAAELTVTDTGLGIPDDERGGLFLPFHRTQRARKHGIAGNGLGLAISRAVVESHRGTIRLVPVAGPGSRVVVRLPIGQAR
ncbi:ATP-binding protein [Paractinoplanes globisporus]|uniref:histidine kinase n=1 Tax=Paractinoplanes globisporus TaxID=113565 RepID=A0ABW6W7B2_9ACTN|nr:ATP-binding protein [Actinoplanes globisporus]